MSYDEIPRIPRRNRAMDDPKMIGLWKIGRTLGSGATARVRIARHLKTGQYAAIKIVSKTAYNSGMPLHKVADEIDHNLLAIDREIVVMKLINHPNIIRLYDVWETSTELYLVLEYIQGGELFDHICHKGRLPTLEALGYFQQIIFAVDYCHRFNIAHRDLKPENILLDQDFNVKIADFGMAVWQANPEDKMLRTACGSPHYAAPEIHNCQAYNGAAADIWSCGIILFALLVGKLPFDDKDNQALNSKVITGKFDMPSDIDPLAQDLIRKMLKKDVGERITMSGIQKHPFFLSQEPKVTNHVMPSLDHVARPIDRPALVDPDIFANLRTLWHGTPDAEIVESLTNDQPNLQKGVYHLLVEYRMTHLANYEEEDELWQTRLQRKRMKSKRAKVTTFKRTHEQLGSWADDTYMGPSASSLPPRDGPPTPRRAKGRIIISPSQSEASISGQHKTGANAPAITPSSPLSPPAIMDALNPPTLTIPEPHGSKSQDIFHHIVERLDDIHVKTGIRDTGNVVASSNLTPLMEALGCPLLPLPNAAASSFASTSTVPDQQPIANKRREDRLADTEEQFLEPMSPRQGISVLGLFNSGTRPLSVQKKFRPQRPVIDIADSNKENIDDDYLVIERTGSIMKSSLRETNGRRADCEKMVHIVEPIDRRRSKLQKKRSTGPIFPEKVDYGSSLVLPTSSPSSSVSSSPKRIWFSNIFKSKPTKYTLLSTHDVHTTRNECRRLLMRMDVRVMLEDYEGPGVLKCQLDDMKDPIGAMGVFKAVKFRVEVHQLVGVEGHDVYAVALLFVREKGSMESFMDIFRRLKSEWSLDVIGSGTPREGSPLTAGGRYVEVEPFDPFYP